MVIDPQTGIFAVAFVAAVGGGFRAYGNLVALLTEVKTEVKLVAPVVESTRRTVEQHGERLSALERGQSAPAVRR
jgi:hypothetical protein